MPLILEIWRFWWFRISLHWWEDVGRNGRWGLARYPRHWSDVLMSSIVSQITGLTIVYSIVYSYADQRKHQSSASLAFVWGIHRGPVNSPHKWPVTQKMFPFDDVITSSGVTQTDSYLGGEHKMAAVRSTPRTKTHSCRTHNYTVASLNRRKKISHDSMEKISNI